MSDRENAEDARQGMADDIAVLVGLFAKLDSAGRGDLLASAARALASERVHGLKAADGTSIDPDDWLSDIAANTYPDGHDAARLVDRAADADPDARKMIFTDGMLATVLCASDDEDAMGESLLAGYKYVRSTVDGMYQPPLPAEHFGINVDKRGFIDSSGDEPVFDEDSWNEEVDRRCAEEFASLVWRWRRDFFAQLISGKRPREADAAHND